MSWSRRSAAAAAVTIVLLTGAAVARAGWSTSTSGGPLAITSGVLNVPANVATALGTCVPKSSVDVIVTWDATAPVAADGYEVLRSTARRGTYTLLATVTGTSYDDTSTGFNTAYFYELEATRADWTSGTSTPVKYKTPKRSCA